MSDVLKGPQFPWAGEGISKRAGVGSPGSSGAEWGQSETRHGCLRCWAAAAGRAPQLWVFGTCWTQTQGIASWIPSIRVILRSVGFSFCHKECDTGGSEDISDDAGNKWCATDPVFSYPASLAMDFLSFVVNFTKYHWVPVERAATLCWEGGVFISQCVYTQNDEQDKDCWKNRSHINVLVDKFLLCYSGRLWREFPSKANKTQTKDCIYTTPQVRTTPKHILPPLNLIICSHFTPCTFHVVSSCCCTALVHHTTCSL